jgi:predicted O-methyltransferase YrrM
MRRYLFGPVSAAFVADNLDEQCRSGECVTFGPGETWESVVGRLPDGWRPEFVVLYLQYTTILDCWWSAPVPIVGLAGDWNLLWHQYRQYRGCDLILTDAAGVERFQREGFTQARRANLFGVSRRFVEADWEAVERDIDILFVGNLHPAVQRERMPWLARISRLADHRRVFIAQGVFGEEYRRLMNRARIVFNRAIRGECNLRTFEAAAAGALLFQEAGNLEVPEYFADRQECVYYEDHNLEELLEYYLDHEEERRAIAEAARGKVREYTWDRFWERQLALISIGVRGEGPGVRKEGVRGEGPGVSQTSRLDRIQRLIEAGRNEAAVEEARAGLRDLDGEVDSALLATVYCLLSTSSFDFLRVEWERAAWQNAGDVAGEIAAKGTLLRSRLHQIVGELTGDLGHLEEAVRSRPDLAVTRMGLGCALGRAGRPGEAVEHLREMVRANPFDLQAARALYQAMKDSGDADGCLAFGRERSLLAKAAPRSVPVEAWHGGAKANSDWQKNGGKNIRGSDFSAPIFLPVVPAEFERVFGNVDTTEAAYGFTLEADTRAVLTLLVHCRAKRILEIGTAGGHMTANFTRWSDEDAVVYTMGIVADLGASTAESQRYELPPRSEFGKHANRFGRADKVFFITADSLGYDFRRLGELDFVFVDGAHDLEHVLSDSRKAYRQLRPGGCLVWHDFNSPTPWVEVNKALGQLDFPEAIQHVEGTQVAFLIRDTSPPRKQGGDVTRAATGSPLAGASGCDVSDKSPRRQQGGDVTRAAIGSRLAGASGCDVSDKSPRREQGGDVTRAATGSSLAGASGWYVRWEGDHEAVHSLGIANRAICAELERRGHVVERVPAGSSDPCPLTPGPLPVWIQHQWPPRWRRPGEGRWILMQQWEFGSLPASWIQPLSRDVDEVWVASSWVRQCFIDSGVPAERVWVIPMGVDPGRFAEGRGVRGQGSGKLKNRKGFRFLFVGGSIHRKGIDLLLEATIWRCLIAEFLCRRQHTSGHFRLLASLCPRHAPERILPFQRKLEGVGDLGHVVTARGPPDDVPGAVVAVVPFELMDVGVRDRGWLLSLLASKRECGALGRREA